MPLNLFLARDPSGELYSMTTGRGSEDELKEVLQLKEAHEFIGFLQVGMGTPVEEAQAAAVLAALRENLRFDVGLTYIFTKLVRAGEQAGLAKVAENAEKDKRHYDDIPF